MAAGTFRLGSGWRGARAEVADGSLALVMPSYIGPNPWSIPVDEVVAVDPGGPAEHEIGAGAVFDLATPVAWFYAWPRPRRSRLELFFRSPQPLPGPLRRRAWRCGLPLRTVRSRAGGRADGVVPGVRDAAGARQLLAEAGVPSTSRAAWIASHPAFPGDPGPPGRGGRWLLVAAMLVPVALGALAGLAVWAAVPGAWLAWLPLALAALAWMLPGRASRMLRR